MNLLYLTLLFVSIYGSGTDPRGAEAQKLANAMGAQLDMAPAQRATDAWKTAQTDYATEKAQLYQSVKVAGEAVAGMKEKSEALEAAKDKKNVEDSKLEQTAVNYLAMQMIKERKATQEMAKERDEALEYVPNMKKHHEQQMQALKDAAVQEANTLTGKIKEEQKRRQDDVNAKIQEIDELETKMENMVKEEKGRTADAIKEGQDNVAQARAEADQEREKMLDANKKLVEQNKNDLTAKEAEITQLEQKVEQTREEGANNLLQAKDAAEVEKKAALDKAKQQQADMENQYQNQLAGVKDQLEKTQKEVTDLQSNLVENNAANQAAITAKTEETDKIIQQMTQDNKAKIAEIEETAKQNLEQSLQQQDQINQQTIAQTESNFETRMENLQQNHKSEIARLTAKVDRAEANYQKETDTANQKIAELRTAENKIEELTDAIKTAQQANTQTAQLSDTLANINVASTGGTSAQTVVTSEELQVAAPLVQTAPINMRFVAVLVSVNLLLGCVAFTYYSENKKSTSQYTAFLEEF